jgi:hypothetical protein
MIWGYAYDLGNHRKPYCISQQRPAVHSGTRPELGPGYVQTWPLLCRSRLRRSCSAFEWIQDLEFPRKPQSDRCSHPQSVSRDQLFPVAAILPCSGWWNSFSFLGGQLGQLPHSNWVHPSVLVEFQVSLLRSWSFLLKDPLSIIFSDFNGMFFMILHVNLQVWTRWYFLKFSELSPWHFWFPHGSKSENGLGISFIRPFKIGTSNRNNIRDSQN